MNLVMARVGDIKITGDNMREDAGDLSELSDSIKRYGVLQPLVVFTQGKKYALIAGHRRLAAARRAGLLEVPVVVRDDLSEEERLSLMIVENVQRKHLTPLEEAHAFDKLRARGKTQDEIAALIDKSQTYVQFRLKLLTCSEEIQQKVHKGQMAIMKAIGYVKVSQKGVPKDQPDGIGRWQIYYMDRLTMWLETGRIKISDDAIAGRLVKLKSAIAALAEKATSRKGSSADLPMCDRCGTFVGPFFKCEEGPDTYCEKCLASTHVLAPREEVAV